MPIMDGNEAIQNILKYENENGLAHTPISALTANVIKGARERGLLSGFDSFLGKPIVIKELERVFVTYLKVNSKDTENLMQNNKETSTIQGIDTEKLSEELMLSNDEVIMLLELFIKKMKKLLPELHDAIANKDYAKIALNAHSIKGSSGNFRIEFLQNSASEMEKMAKNERDDYDYEQNFQEIKSRVLKIKIS